MRSCCLALPVLLLAAVVGCARGAGAPGGGAQDGGTGRAPEASPSDAPSEAAPAPETVYTWYDAAGVPHLAARVEDVPEAARGQVVVSRLGSAPEAALADEVTVGDFTGDAPAFSKVDLSRLAGRAEPGTPPSHDGVFVYSTPWCGYCKKAKAWLKAHDVPFVDRDIEESAEAAAELKAKLKEAGVRFGGVPVLDVRGKIVVGFDRKALEAALAQTSAGPDGGTPKQDG